MKEHGDVSDAVLDAMLTVEDNIVMARTVRGLTQIEAAKACGISPGTYQAVEKGSLSPSVKAYAKVLDYFGMSKTLAFMGAAMFDTEGRDIRLSKKTK